MATLPISGTPSRLAVAPINLSAIRDDAVKELFDLLEKVEGRICLVIEPNLATLMKLVVADGSKTLKEHRVDAIHELVGDMPPQSLPSCDSILFMTRPSIQNIKTVAAQAKVIDSKHMRKQVHLAFVPRRTFICEQVLRDETVDHLIKVWEYGLDIIPLDDDLLTLGLDTCFSDCCVQGDTSSLYYITRALLKLQSVFGPFNHVRAKGTLSKQVLDMMMRMKREQEGILDRDSGVSPAAAPGTSTTPALGGHIAYVTDAGTTGRPEIDQCVIIDRDVDLVSPLVTPLTYEGLLDETLGLNNTTACLDAALVKDDSDDAPDEKGGPPRKSLLSQLPKGSKVLLHMNGNNKLYAEIRDTNFAAAGPKLQAKAREIQTLRDSVMSRNRNDININQIAQFVKQIPGLQQDMKTLRILINILEIIQKCANDPKFVERWHMENRMIDEENSKEVYEAITAAISRRQPLVTVLRLLCLQSVIEGGLKPKWLEHFRRAVIASYGYEHIFTLRNLDKAGLLSGREGGGVTAFASQSSAWKQVKDFFKLSATEINPLEEPTDIHYVTSGYAPLSVRLVEAAIAPQGWENEKMYLALRLLPGPSSHVLQILKSAKDAPAGKGRRSSKVGQEDAEEAGIGTGRSERKVVLVVYIGGVSHIELSALRFIAEKQPFDFIVLTTAVINGSQLMESIFEPISHSRPESQAQAREAPVAVPTAQSTPAKKTGPTAVTAQKGGK